ncbi:AmmeMemoRadiSam system protein B [Acidithiobacillus sp. AMEEHan]|uniref:AmmeMemoRadiSam system protein B n=1 Tax=Acidithiobacillus sp. AMEEHan TaxID=2994951 RepID=UPI0027E42020|nr:AmmeMemoRadiSam system protein B [Acidithiobacillus sp. AMEEHan]
MTRIRPAAVAGTFYSNQTAILHKDVQKFLREAGLHSEREASSWPKALIVPHAGYVYSGIIAASAYKLLATGRGKIRRVVILGPAHRVPFRGIALPGVDAFQTPLGALPVDRTGVGAIKHLPQVLELPIPHAQEHALEVQLPFLQEVLGQVFILPLVVGKASPREVAEVLDALWDGPETVILISSDLSHYHPYAEARNIDNATVQQILRLDTTPIHHDQACGATPINGLLQAAQRHHLWPRLLDLRNSGDTAGSRDAVVGYAAFAFFTEPTTS